MPPTATVSEYHSSFKGNTTTTRRSWHTTDSDTTRLSWADTSPKPRYDLIVEHLHYTAMVDAKINKIEHRFNSGEITKDEAVRQVRSLQKSLRRKINKGTIKEKSTYGRLK